MTAQVVLLIVTALLALVAIGAAVVAVRAQRATRVADETAAPLAVETPVETSDEPVGDLGTSRAVEVVHGRVVATLTQQDLLEARLSRPAARLAVYTHGVAHALRPEARDRIAALVRREYRRRRAIRLKAARRAMRTLPSDTLRVPSAPEQAAPEHVGPEQAVVSQ